jgi:hypothetical protein
MPLKDELKPVYEDHICPIATRLGFTVKRADGFFSTYEVMREVWSAILGASILIADCTDRNPNVFYELGVAHTVGKSAILIAQSMSDVPFDITHRRVIQYTFTPRGMKEFESALELTLGRVDEIIRDPTEDPPRCHSALVLARKLLAAWVQSLSTTLTSRPRGVEPLTKHAGSRCEADSL